jgi:hypothetical protein
MITFMKRKQIDLGEQSVRELTILEYKKWFSIKLFNFLPTTGKQDRFHTHAFNAISILLKGDYTEEIIREENNRYTVEGLPRSRKRFLFIPANEYHRITRSSGCLAVVITGPWGEGFKELRHLAQNFWHEVRCGPQRRDLQMGIGRVIELEETT